VQLIHRGLEQKRLERDDEDMRVREYQAPNVTPIQALQRFRVGERWAYRKRPTDDLTEAEILKLSIEKRPVRIKVRHLDDEFRGEVAWVKPAHLWVRWPEVAAMRTSEAKWSRVRGDRPPREETWISEYVLSGDFGGSWESYDDPAGVGIVRNEYVLAAHLGLPVEAVRDPAGFDEPDGRVVGWSVVRRMTVAALLRDDAREAKEMIANNNASRRERLEYVTDLRKRGELDYRFLPDNHPVFDPNLPWVDFGESGLRALLPGYLSLAKRHEVAEVLDESVALLELASDEFRHGPKALRRLELAERMGKVADRARQALAEERGSVAHTVQSAESPQEHP
jgi:hypothetical protein